MSRKTNIINYIITMAITLGSLFLVVYFCNSRYSLSTFDALWRFAVFAIVVGLINTFVHELGHLFCGKKNGYVFSSMSVWFFRWRRVRKKIRFDFIMLGEEAGYTEMIPTNVEKVADGLKKMTRGGIVGSFICMLLGVPALFMTFLPVELFCLLSLFLPIGAYFFFGSALPASSYGVRNDGAVLYGLKKNDDVSWVTINLLKIQANLYCGKTPGEIDEKLYFDLPQLPEDDLVFAMLLNARYNFYLDKGDFEKAKLTVSRLLSLEEYLPKGYLDVVKTDALYNACTFDYNEELADDIMYEIEKYINNVNTASTVRAKTAYLLYVKQETEHLDVFFKKGYKEAERCQIKGLGMCEKKLFDKMYNDYQKLV